MRPLHLLRLLVVVAFVGALGLELYAAELAGTVSAGFAGGAEIQIEGELVPSAGDAATIYFKLPGGNDEVVVGTGKITSVAGAVATVKLDDSSVTPQKDQSARITSANPQKRSAAASPTAAPASVSTGTPGSDQAITASLVGRWTGRSADGLQGTIVFKGDGTITVPLQHTRGGWVSGKYSIDSSAMPARVIITDLVVHPPPAAFGRGLEIHEHGLKLLKQEIPDAFARKTWIAEIVGHEQMRIEGFAEGTDKRQPLSASASILKKLGSGERELVADYIPPTEVFVEVWGAVVNDRRVPWKEGMTLLDAIDAAGGFAAGADSTRVELRDHLGERVYVPDPRTFQLNPIDRIYVPLNSAAQPSPSARDLTGLLNQAEDLRQAGKRDEALAVANLAVATYPQNGNAYRVRALYHSMAEPKKTVADADRALALGCDDMASAYFFRAQGHFSAKDFKASLIDLNRALELRPEGDEGYAWRAGAKFNLHDRKGALADCEKALELNPKNANAHYWRGVYFAAMGKMDSAESDWQKAVSLDPKFQATIDAARATLEADRRKAKKKSR